MSRQCSVPESQDTHPQGHRTQPRRRQQLQPTQSPSFLCLCGSTRRSETGVKAALGLATGFSLGETQGMTGMMPSHQWEQPGMAQEGTCSTTRQTSIPTLKSRFKDVDLPWEIPAAITDPE